MRFSPWKIGKYTRWASCWDQYSWVSAIPEDCHFNVLKSANGGLLCRPLWRPFFRQAAPNFAYLNLKKKIQPTLFNGKKKSEPQEQQQQKNLCNYKSYTQISNYRTLTLQVQTYISYTLNSTVACQVSCQLVEKKIKSKEKEILLTSRLKLDKSCDFYPGMPEGEKI